MKNNENYTLITGGTEGIGYELAKLFAEDKHNLILVARDEANLAVVKNELSQQGVDVITITKDLFEPDAAFELFEEYKTKILRWIF